MEILWDYVAATDRRHARARAVRGARAGPDDARRLLLAHRVVERARQRRRARCARRRAPRARSRSSTARTRRDRSRSTSPRSARRLRRELPQVAVRAEGLGVPLRAPGGAGTDRAARRLVGLGSTDAPFHDRHRWQGTRDPSALPRGPGRDRLPGRARLAGGARALPRAARRAFRDECGLEPLTDDFVQMLGFRAAGRRRRGVPARRSTSDTGSRCRSSRRRTAGRCASRSRRYNDDGDVDALLAALGEQL